jgi:plasmid stabilization system protein ParE
MAKVVVEASAFDDLNRLFDFLVARDAAAAHRAIETIQDGLMLLERHPEVGRPSNDGLRELIISYGATGYVALYAFYPAWNLVTVFKLRHQRELGYQ